MIEQENKKTYILNYSAGKDSTALLIHILENKLPLDEIIYIDFGAWTWKGTNEHIKQVENKLNVNITKINVEKELIKQFNKYGFPHFKRRWCTGIKRQTINNYLKNKYGNSQVIQYIGYTADEKKRSDKKLNSKHVFIYPLIDIGVTNNDALSMCKSYGFNFNGVYNHHAHYNCWLCPLQRVTELKYIYDKCPEYWNILKEMQNKVDGYYSNKKTIYEYEKRFKQMNTKEKE